MYRLTYHVGLPGGPGSHQTLINLVQEHFPDGATVVFGKGVWKGEVAVVTEVVYVPRFIEGFIKACKKSLGQEKILVVTEKLLDALLL